MELSEKIFTLEAEKKQYIQMIDNLNAEKIALDQMYVGSLKEVLNAKKEIILLNQKINDTNQDHDVLIKEKEVLNKTIEDLKKPIESSIEPTTEL